ncbi:hypothetical protein [Chryseobacterium sp. R2ACT005]|uniref:hypothetical protein n=1 Tax=Chryseobacterium sp. R2ACT005 TaxID=3416668 RepID=UPI003CEE9C2E
MSPRCLTIASCGEVIIKPPLLSGGFIIFIIKPLAFLQGVFIIIENRWSEFNGGIRNLKVKDSNNLAFICKRINQFSEGEEVRVSHNHGYLTIFLNGQKVDIIFTVKNGIVYRVGVGRYVYDEELTVHILKLMKIKNRCWGEDCK